jgi:hypothetical protein
MLPDGTIPDFENPDWLKWATTGNGSSVFGFEVFNFGGSGFFDYNGNGRQDAGEDVLNSGDQSSFTARDLIDRGFDTDNSGSISGGEADAFIDYMEDAWLVPFA